MMGWEGVFGILFTIMIAVPSQFLSCPFSEYQCVNGHIDDFALAYSQMRENKFIVLLALLYIICAACFNAFGSFATKFTSAANRTVVE